MLKKFYNEQKIEQINKSIIFILMIVIGLAPIITYKYQSISYSPIFENNMFSTGIKSDIFNFFKSMVVYLGTVSVFGLFIYKLIYLKEEVQINKVNILLLSLMVILSISIITSDYKDISLLGNFDRHEGGLIWICYIFITFVLCNIKIEYKYFDIFYCVLVPFLLLNTVLAVVKLFGIDLLQSSIIQAMMGGKGNLKGQLFTTLYHYNFGSGVAAVLFSMSYMYMLLEENKNKKIILLITSVLSFAMLLSLISNGGFITVVIILPIIITLAYNLINKKDLLIWSVILFILNTMVFLILNAKNPVVYDESMAIFAKINKISPLVIPATIVVFISILFLTKFINKKKFFNIVISIVLVCTIISIGIYSYILNKQNKELVSNPQSSVVRIQDKDTFKKLNEMSTDRLNIWTKTLNLINQKPLLGHGFDTFPYVFLSSDDNGGLSTYGEVIDKPHNWYLSIAYGSGYIALAGVLSIIIFVIKGIFDSCVDKIHNKYLYVFGIGSIAYAIQGIFNDSLVGTSIIFWIILGITINIILSNRVENN